MYSNILRSHYVAGTPPVEARSPGRLSNVENAPLPPPRRQLVTGQQRAHTLPTAERSHCRHIAGWTQVLCCHSNATRAPIANPLNSAQQGGRLYHALKLHPGPCSSVGVRPRADTQTRLTTIHFASSTTHTQCNNTRTNQTKLNRKKKHKMLKPNKRTKILNLNLNLVHNTQHRTIPVMFPLILQTTI